MVINISEIMRDQISLGKSKSAALWIVSVAFILCLPSPAYGNVKDPKDVAKSGVSTLTAEQKLQIETEVEKAKTELKTEMMQQNADNLALIERIFRITGLFTTLAALGAFFTLKSAREDARDQIAGSGKLLDAFEHNADTRLNAVRDNAELKLNTLTTEMEEFKKKLSSELPEIRNLKEGLRELLQYLESVIPGESNWNDGEPYEGLSVAQKQNVLISESTIGALQIFISPEAIDNRSTLMRLYCSLARFYFGRYRKEKRVEDVERAHVYASKCLNINGDYGEAHRLRGAFYLATYYVTKDATSGPEVALLEKAESSLRTAIEKNNKDLGAIYNLAYALASRTAIQEAFQVSIGAIERAIKKPGEFPDYQLRKYGASIFGNAGCYCCILADQIQQLEEQKSLHKEAARVIQEGYKLLEGTRHRPSIKSLQTLIVRELAEGGDMKNLPANERVILEEILLK